MVERGKQRHCLARRSLKPDPGRPELLTSLSGGETREDKYSSPYQTEHYTVPAPFEALF